MITVKPFPRRYASVIIQKNPLQSLYIILRHRRKSLLITRRKVEFILKSAVSNDVYLVIFILPLFEFLLVLAFHGKFCFLNSLFRDLRTIVFTEYSFHGFFTLFFRFEILLEM